MRYKETPKRLFLSGTLTLLFAFILTLRAAAKASP
jgi:hypothetical protein